MRVLILLAVLLLPLASADAPNPVQAGERTDCLDASATTVVGRLLVPSRWAPLHGVVDVEAGTGYRVTHGGTRAILVFFADDDAVVGRALDAREGVVPDGAVRASVCVQEGAGAWGDGPLAYRPAVAAEWSYQDGF